MVSEEGESELELAQMMRLRPIHHTLSAARRAHAQIFAQVSSIWLFFFLLIQNYVHFSFPTLLTRRIAYVSTWTLLFARTKVIEPIFSV